MLYERFQLREPDTSDRRHEQCRRRSGWHLGGLGVVGVVSAVQLAAETGPLKSLRKNKSAENLLRVLLLHFGCGHSLLETAVRAQQEGLAA